MTAIRRLKKEMTELANYAAQFQAGPANDSNFLEWEGTILGPENTPYENGKFKVKLSFPLEYPLKAPKLSFLTKIFHPNISEKGEICLEILKSWDPNNRIVAIFQQIQTLLLLPNTDDALRCDVANMIKTNNAEFQKIAKDFTEQHAK